jgi:hypothetical protein
MDSGYAYIYARSRSLAESSLRTVCRSMERRAQPLARRLWPHVVHDDGVQSVQAVLDAVLGGAAQLNAAASTSTGDGGPPPHAHGQRLEAAAPAAVAHPALDVTIILVTRQQLTGAPRPARPSPCGPRPCPPSFAPALRVDHRSVTESPLPARRSVKRPAAGRSAVAVEKQEPCPSWRGAAAFSAKEGRRASRVRRWRRRAALQPVDVVWLVGSGHMCRPVSMDVYCVFLLLS